jgi:hypothetical protein
LNICTQVHPKAISKNYNNKKKEEQGAFLKIPCIRIRRMCRSFNIKLRQSNKFVYYEHVIVISPTQAKQCKWLVQMEPNWVRDLLWIDLDSNNLDLGRGTNFLLI